MTTTINNSTALAPSKQNQNVPFCYDDKAQNKSKMASLRSLLTKNSETSPPPSVTGAMKGMQNMLISVTKVDSHQSRPSQTQSNERRPNNQSQHSSNIHSTATVHQENGAAPPRAFQSFSGDMDAWSAPSLVSNDVQRVELTVGELRTKIANRLSLPRTDQCKLVIGGRILNNDSRSAQRVKSRWGERPFVCLIPTERLLELQDKNLALYNLSRAELAKTTDSPVTSLLLHLRDDDSFSLSKWKPVKEEHPQSPGLRRQSPSPTSPRSSLQRSLAATPTRSPRRSLEIPGNAPQQDFAELPDIVQRLESDWRSKKRYYGRSEDIILHFDLMKAREDVPAWESKCSKALWTAGKLRMSHIKQHILKSCPWIQLSERIQLLFNGEQLFNMMPVSRWYLHNANTRDVNGMDPVLQITIRVRDIFTVHYGNRFETIYFDTESISDGKVTIGDIRANVEEVFHVPTTHKALVFYGNKVMDLDNTPARAFDFSSTAPNNIRCNIVQKAPAVTQQPEYELTESRRLLKVDTALASPPVELLSPSKPGLRARDCVVCGDTVAPSDFPKTVSGKCAHEPSTCTDCVQQWISSELDAKGWDKIRCPECPSLLQHNEIRSLATSETFDRYDALATRSALSTDPDFHFCLSPTCDSGQIHPSAQTFPIMTCNACHFRSCLIHATPWHEHETCAQYDYRHSGRKAADDDKKSEQWKKANTKSCPGKNCGWMIEKNDGCDHMTCRKCRYEFCWLCMCDYDRVRRGGNRFHNRGCKHWRT